MQEVDRLLEATRLFHQRSDQILGEHLRYAGDVEDVLLGIKRRELAAGVGECVDDLRRYSAHARIKKSKESRRPSAEDRNVFDLLSHSLTFAAQITGYKPSSPHAQRTTLHAKCSIQIAISTTTAPSNSSTRLPRAAWRRYTRRSSSGHRASRSASL